MVGGCRETWTMRRRLQNGVEFGKSQGKEEAVTAERAVFSQGSKVGEPRK